MSWQNVQLLRRAGGIRLRAALASKAAKPRSAAFPPARGFLCLGRSRRMADDDSPLVSRLIARMERTEERLDRAEAALAKIRELHERRDVAESMARGDGVVFKIQPYSVCRHCSLDWPCPTTQALGEPRGDAPLLPVDEYGRPDAHAPMRPAAQYQPEPKETA